MAAASWVLKFLFHVVTFGVYACALIYDTFYLTAHIGRQTYGGRFKFLTFWNELIQTGFFAYSIINDVFGSNSPPPAKGKKQPIRSQLQKARDFVAASIVFPTGAFVVIMFWSIYCFDRELIFPKAIEAFIPPLLNHIWHTSVIFFLLIEKAMVYHHYPRRSQGLTFSALFVSIYGVWIFWVAYWADLWIYPVLAVMNWLMRIVFCLCSAAFFAVLYLMGEFITNAIWASGSDVQPEKVK